MLAVELVNLGFLVFEFNYFRPISFKNLGTPALDYLNSNLHCSHSSRPAHLLAFTIKSCLLSEFLEVYSPSRIELF